MRRSPIQERNTSLSTRWITLLLSLLVSALLLQYAALVILCHFGCCCYSFPYNVKPLQYVGDNVGRGGGRCYLAPGGTLGRRTLGRARFQPPSPGAVGKFLTEVARRASPALVAHLDAVA